MRASSLLFGLTLLLVGCRPGANPTTPSPSPGGGNTASFAGTWAGTATDSSGSMMGSGFGSSSSLTLQLTQNGTQVTGSMSIGGFTTPAGRTPPTFSGTASGNTVTFTMSFPAGTIPTATGVLCSATANGTMTLNSAANAMSGTYTGTSSCVGAFLNGQITLTKQ